MNRLEVDDTGGASKVEEVLSGVAVASAAPLLAADVGESMFDSDSFA